MKKNILLILLAGAALLAFGQKPVMELSFTAVNNNSHVQLDSIKVINQTQEGDTVLYWPDTVLSFYYVGIPEVIKDDKAFRVFQNYPNPVTDHTTVSMYVPQKDNVSILITNLLGRIILVSEKVLDQGTHTFQFTPGASSLYFFTARWRGTCSSIKILQAGSRTSGRLAIEYTGGETSSPQLKAVQVIQDFFFSPGDELLYVGYVNGLESGIPDSPEESKDYTFQFATNIPCLGTPTVEYEGKVYNTIQIFNQCWLKENLDVGTMKQLSGFGAQWDNGIVEKYCYNNDTNNCNIYGGLYQWDEMMLYTTQQGAQGICPPGWHLPTDEEWKVLEGAVDSQYGIGDPEWNTFGEYRGYDAGTNLKTTNGWLFNGNGTDLFGFSGLPGGYSFIQFNGGGFTSVGSYGCWWTSTEHEYDYAWSRVLSYDGYDGPGVRRSSGEYKSHGLSVRCIRYEAYTDTLKLTFTAVNNLNHVQLDSIKVMNRTLFCENMISWPDTTIAVPGDLCYSPNDELLFIGYSDALESGMTDFPQENQDYTFQFATNMPCPGTPTVEYEGQIYNTIQIFSQCWLKENLNTGTMIEGTIEQSNNGTIEKYCYNDEPDSCNKYGGLYQWNEMMQYTMQQGARGICPTGWHLPTDEEWKVLEGAVDSQYIIGDHHWDDWGEFGFDAGKNLKTTSGWYDNGNGTDLFGFSALPGGSGFNYGIGSYGYWWTSSEFEEGLKFHHDLYYWSNGAGRDAAGPTAGFSVRCLRDD